MQRLGELSTSDFHRRLAAGDLPVRVGPYVYNIHSDLPAVAQGLRALYGDFLLATPQQFVDYDVALVRGSPLQRLRGRAEFLFDRASPFETIPAGQAYAFLEWGMNWCVSLHANEYLKLHAAVVAREGAGVILPGTPGAGKSTLCAALGLQGWRILSDEHALVVPHTTDLVPLCRPVSLKNASIDVVRAFSRDAVFGPVSLETHKGVVCHMKADLTTDSHDPAPLPARALVFPRYSAGDGQYLRPRPRSESFIIAAYHSFNYSLMGEAGFHAMRHLVSSVPCYDLVYRDLDWAVQAMEKVLV